MTALAQDVPPIPPAPVAPALAATTQSVPRTAEEVAGLRAQRTELSDQLQSAARRRSSIAETMQDASAAELPGLQARLQLLDSRILQIESDIDRTGQLIAQAPGQFLAETDGPNFGPFVNTGPNMRPDFTAITIVITLFVVAPIAFAYARNVWRRGSLASAPPVIDKETAERLKRLEAGVDSIAFEVERISEGQRFVTKLMAEREKPRIEAGQ